VEPEIADAVADLDGQRLAEAPPAHETPHAREAPAPQPFEPVAREVAPEPPAPAESSRRRSTVREPAPMFSSGSMSDVQPASVPMPPPEPAVTPPEPAATEAPAEAKPRRFGWWNRRG